MSGETKKEAERGRDFEQIGYAVHQIGAHMGGYQQWPVTLVGFSVRGPKVKFGEFLVTIRGVDAEGARWVAFHSSYNLGDLMRGLCERARNGDLKWKEDQYAR